MRENKWRVPEELWEQDRETAERMTCALRYAYRAAVVLEGKEDPEADYMDILGLGWGRLLQNPRAAQDLAEAVHRSVTGQAAAVLLSVDIEAGGYLDGYERGYLQSLLEEGTPPLEAWAEVLGFRDLPNFWAAAQAEAVGVKAPGKLREAAEWWLCAWKIWEEYGKEALADASEYGACELLERLREGGE